MTNGETFFTVIGCMDGRVQEVTTAFGKEKFDAKYPDKISEAGMVGIISNNPSPEFVQDLKSKLLISIEKHHSKGILVDGHQECAGNPVTDEEHKHDIKKSVEFISNLIGNRLPVYGIFVVRDEDEWRAEEV
ncbi:MAG: hypothetical protein A2776_03210 [Candidatus Levybacteria bacterium RIFCSPHIGHO2_01_FULL_40_10]|nr:MAG: hypothetical protein A2776_03210 [Candidatus Levybacteria bacterium RIFCSPHIGHO2_01_FULL_40_10]